MAADDRPRPAKIALADVPITPAADAVTKVRIARLITRQRHGSNLLLGASWFDPGEETNLWSSADENDMGDGDHWYGPVDETYFIIRGRFELEWSDDAGERGVLELGPDDAVFLAPRWHYRLRCVSDEPGFFVYGMSPTPE
jgi:hypothetical protein